MTYIGSVDSINYFLKKLFPIGRSLTGPGNLKTLNIIREIIEDLDFKRVKSGTKFFDWTIPPEWTVEDAFLLNSKGEKIIDWKECNLCLLNYSQSYEGIVDKETLLEHLYTMPSKPDWIPYRTSYYKKKWGFCAKHKLINSSKFSEPFKVVIKTKHDSNGELLYGECLKKGKNSKEIILSTYFCHPSMGNDNLSGLLTASLLFNYIKRFETNYSYRLLIIPETIGSICFLANCDKDKIIGGTVITNTAGPDKLSIKNSFESNSWVNQISHLAISDFTNNDYITYSFSPDGSDERQYSSPGFRINTPSFHKSKYYEYDEYHTSADDLNFISAENLQKSLKLYKKWFHYIDSYSFPKRTSMECEYQLGKRGLMPSLGGATYQKNIDDKQQVNLLENNHEISIKDIHMESFNWIMHLADGFNSNLNISQKSGIPLEIINEAISIFKKEGLLTD